MLRAALLLLAAGCASTGETSWDGVQGAEWLLTRIEGAPPLEGTEITLAFDVGRLYGRAVNLYSAQYERTGDALAIDAIAATEMFRDHPPGAMAQEARYLGILQQVDGWTGGGWLELTRKGETVLVFRRHGSRARS